MGEAQRREVSAEKENPKLEGLDLFYQRWSKGIVGDSQKGREAVVGIVTRPKGPGCDGPGRHVGCSHGRAFSGVANCRSCSFLPRRLSRSLGSLPTEGWGLLMMQGIMKPTRLIYRKVLGPVAPSVLINECQERPGDLLSAPTFVRGWLPTRPHGLS